MTASGRPIWGIYEAKVFATWAGGRVLAVHETLEEALQARRDESHDIRVEQVLTDGNWYITVRALKVDALGAGFHIEQKLASGRVRHVEAVEFDKCSASATPSRQVP